MALRYELLLMCGIVVLYLYDSVVMLSHNEIVLVLKHGRWCVAGGSSTELAGRHAFLPNPFFPQRPLIRIGWWAGEPACHRDSPSRLDGLSLALSRIKHWNIALYALFFLGLPTCLLIAERDVALLVWMFAIYSLIITTLTQVYRTRATLNLTLSSILSLAVDALLCAPFAMNIVRKVSLLQPFDLDLRNVAENILEEPEFAALLCILQQRIQTSLYFVTEGGREALELALYLKYFEDLQR